MGGEQAGAGPIPAQLPELMDELLPSSDVWPGYVGQRFLMSVRQRRRNVSVRARLGERSTR
jgi:hypothetical protein